MHGSGEFCFPQVFLSLLFTSSENRITFLASFIYNPKGLLSELGGLIWKAVSLAITNLTYVFIHIFYKYVAFQAIFLLPGGQKLGYTRMSNMDGI